MNKTKKSFFLKVAGLMAAVMMLTTCVVAGTMAKYTSSGTSGDITASAATWEIKVNDTSIVENTYDLNTLKFTVLPTQNGAKADSYEENVILPGTYGYAEVTVKNEGQVDAVLTISKGGSATTTHNGLKFAIVKEQPSEELTSATLTDMTLENIEIKHTGGSNSTTFYIVYCWDFDDANNAEADFVNPNTIIPGTWGYAVIEIENKSDVDAIVAIKGLDSILPSPSDHQNGAVSFKYALRYGDAETGAPSSYSELESDVGSEDQYLSDGIPGYKMKRSGQDDSILCIYICYQWEWEYVDPSKPTVDNNERDVEMAENSYEFSFGSLTIIAEQAKITAE